MDPSFKEFYAYSVVVTTRIVVTGYRFACKIFIQ
jgi:hypothetical protein